MLAISDTGMPTKGRVWESGTKHQAAQFSSRGISKGVFAQVTEPESLVQQDVPLPVQG